MSSPTITYKNLPGPVGDCLKPSSLSTTATVPVSPTTSLVFTTGHIGLDLKTGALVNSSPEAEFEAIFNCLDEALKHAGITTGLCQAYKFVSYLTSAQDEAVMQRIFHQRFPYATPTWATAIVKEINVPGMRAEIVAEAVLFNDA
ncbi:hypothetical protein BO79DRAFT_268333 [Aspergillus costaricaensis CBS 115574]|uniref:Uncharacterized protein n=1 Tax=Aspergillus costaricaensis CBS 115574 TaxID=1448317 RepID=A0ACD1ITU8_9EURO|nr:hypothetical protein BO79DRAFT_268333 [Aspergillus costaricaensis CBS 115574]RAK93885.1 hypothetical protein BO79DRAFT_268333 [Aspergillus costaricaensis CBS 115574]